jgi:hypothetical protein
MSSEKYFQVDLPKQEGTPVYPLVRSRMDLIKGLIAGYVLGEPEYTRLPEWGTPHTGLSLWERFVYACNLVSTESEGVPPDYRVYLRVYDKIHNTMTVELPGLGVDDSSAVSSIPLYDDPAVGYRPMSLGEKVLYYDGKGWITRWVSDPRRKGDTVELASVEDIESADTEWVPMAYVIRQTLQKPATPDGGAPKKTAEQPAATPTASLINVEGVWQN